MLHTSFSLFELAPLSLFIIAGALLFPLLLYLSGAIRYLRNDQLGLVEKKFGMNTTLSRGVIALDGEVGFQPDILRGGIHFMLPFYKNIYKYPLITVRPGSLGYVIARDGVPFSPGQIVARDTSGEDFTDVRAFIEKGGQKGLQGKVLRDGTYALNPAQFVVLTKSGVWGHLFSSQEEKQFLDLWREIEERDGFSPVEIGKQGDKIGIVTINDGAPLQAGEIIAPDIENELDTHNSFQNPDAFVRNGGKRGIQLRTLTEGTYYLNRKFGDVRSVPKTTVPVGQVGVVISNHGRKGKDLSGESYGHGELVEPGERGVWKTALLPGKYPVNIDAETVYLVPTTNVILKWKRSETGSHNYDENLAEISINTKDGYELKLPLSVVVHIDYRDAPRVIQRFGDIKKLVEQSLDPLVSAYFKNVAQQKTVLELLQDRAFIQKQSADDMKERFKAYDLILDEVLIGTPEGGEAILQQLRERQLAFQQQETYLEQIKAQETYKKLVTAQTTATAEKQLTEAQVSVKVEEAKGNASIQAAEKERQKRILEAEAAASVIERKAQADAKATKMVAEAEAERIRVVGEAQAQALLRQIESMGDPGLYSLREIAQRFAQALENSKQKLTPEVMILGNKEGSSNGVMEAIGTMLLAKLHSSKTSDTSAE